ncbi:hypothetical protein ACIREM_32690 [Streptomyces shenzhenensis]|uniref:hypothetical protein n=1 Tax=Streptomyces shenzhenensis TaxID=943815 RepID=UPI0037FB5443
MPRQIEQLPPDATSLARRVRALERALDELRASRRASHTTIAEGAIAVARPGSDTPAAVMSTDLGDGNAGFQTNSADGATYARLEAGELTFGARDIPQVVPTGIRARIDGGVLDIQSGMISEGAQAHILMASGDSPLAPGDGAPMISLMWDGAGSADMIVDVSGILLPRNMAWGTVSITPSAANTPTSMTVTGLTVRGSTFIAGVTPVTNAPGTAVTGVSVNNVSSTGLTVWLTRTNTTTTSVNWWVIGA